MRGWIDEMVRRAAFDLQQGRSSLVFLTDRYKDEADVLMFQRGAKPRLVRDTVMLDCVSE